jgi:pantoate--beta-alanine ligase
MKTLRSAADMTAFSNRIRQEGGKIAFVPTMGYLHQGHVSLIHTAKKYTDIVVTSIFVNPIQFGPSEDLESYPRDLKRDKKTATNAGTAVLFVPSEKELYPAGFQTFVNVEELSRGLCGRSRSGHFRGVTTVVAKLFNIVKPHYAVFGQKDAQQVAVIQRMITDLNYDIELVVAPIIRDQDGLAMSSRNSYLSSGERQDALVLHRALRQAEEMVRAGERNSQTIMAKMQQIITSAPSSNVDYIEIVDQISLVPVQFIDCPVIVAIAVFIGKTRLIDNCYIS